MKIFGEVWWQWLLTYAFLPFAICFVGSYFISSAMSKYDRKKRR